LAKLRAGVITRRNISVAERTHIEILESNIREIRTSLAELAAASHSEWRAVRERLDQRLVALDTSVMDLKKSADLKSTCAADTAQVLNGSGTHRDF